MYTLTEWGTVLSDPGPNLFPDTVDAIKVETIEGFVDDIKPGRSCRQNV